MEILKKVVVSLFVLFGKILFVILKLLWGFVVMLYNTVLEEKEKFDKNRIRWEEKYGKMDKERLTRLAEKIKQKHDNGETVSMEEMLALKICKDRFGLF